MTRATMTRPRLTVGELTYEMDLGVIRETFLGWEDHGIFTIVLSLDFGTSHQGAGTLVLSNRDGEAVRPYALLLILVVMETVGVECWETLPGKRVYALRPDSGYDIHGLAHATRPEETYLIFERFIERYEDAGQGTEGTS